MIAQAFIGSQWTNPSSWNLFDETLLLGGPLWTHLRYDLENGVKPMTDSSDLLEKHRNRRTQIVGYLYDQTFEKEPTALYDMDFRYLSVLKSTDRLQAGSMILCVRQGMPIGGKTHTPLNRNKTVLSLQEEAREIEALIADGPRYQMLIAKGGSMKKHQEEKLAKIQEKFPRRETVLMYLDSIRKKASLHVSELDIQIHTQESKVPAWSNQDEVLVTQCQQTDVKVPPSQKCFECMAIGAHHNEACFLQERVQRDERPLWSTSKFKVAWKPGDNSDDD